VGFTSSHYQNARIRIVNENGVYVENLKL